jgi:hypothetical protein
MQGLSAFPHHRFSAIKDFNLPHTPNQENKSGTTTRRQPPRKVLVLHHDGKEVMMCTEGDIIHSTPCRALLLDGLREILPNGAATLLRRVSRYTPKTSCPPKVRHGSH